MYTFCNWCIKSQQRNIVTVTMMTKCWTDTHFLLFRIVEHLMKMKIGETDSKRLLRINEWMVLLCHWKVRFAQNQSCFFPAIERLFHAFGTLFLRQTAQRIEWIYKDNFINMFSLQNFQWMLFECPKSIKHSIYRMTTNRMNECSIHIEYISVTVYIHFATSILHHLSFS